MIHLLWATIRPNTFINTHSVWMKRSKNPQNIKTHIAVSSKDHENIILDNFKNDNYRLILAESPTTGVCFPCYSLSSTLEGNDGDIVIFGSDDFFPPKEWDDYLIKKLENKEGGLMVRDGYQLPDSSNMLFPAITIPIMTWGCFMKLNKIIYHPSYSHMFSDCELYLTLKEMGLLIDDRLSDTTEFEHKHYAAGKRSADSNDQKYHEHWKEDEMNWNKRRTMTPAERNVV